MSIHQYTIFAFSALWITSGIIGYWELVTYLKERPFFKRVPIWAWAVCECLLPMLAIELYCIDFSPQTFSLLITYVVAASMIYPERNLPYAFVCWLTVIVGYFGIKDIPILLAYQRFSLVFLIAGAAAPLLNRLKSRLVWTLIYPLLLLFVIYYVDQFYVDGTSISIKNAVQWACTSLPIFAYLSIQQHRRVLLKQRYHDPLTGALNRRGYDAWIDSKRGLTGAFLVVDLDDFKYMNDTFGHDAGDAVLVHVVRRMKESLRNSDEVVRFGGDEFICLLPGVSEDEARDISIRVHHAIVTDTVFVRNITLSIRASMGVAQGTVDHPLLIQADQRLLQAKRKGKNSISYAHGDDVISIHNKHTETSPLRWIADAMRALVEFSPQGFVLTDDEHKIVEVNPAFEAMTGYARSELLGVRPKLLAAKSNQNSGVYKELKHELSRVGFWKGTFMNERPNTEIWKANETISAIKIGGKVVGYWALVLQDDDVKLESEQLRPTLIESKRLIT